MKATFVLALLGITCAIVNSATISTTTDHFLEGTWYGYNQHDAPLGCCIPNGIITFTNNNGQTTMTVSEWLAGPTAQCPTNGVGFIVPGLDSTKSYDQLPNMDQEPEELADPNGYTYYMDGLQYQSNWNNGTQQVLMNITMFQKHAIAQTTCEAYLSKDSKILAFGSALLALMASLYVF